MLNAATEAISTIGQLTWDACARVAALPVMAEAAVTAEDDGCSYDFLSSPKQKNLANESLLRDTKAERSKEAKVGPMEKKQRRWASLACGRWRDAKSTSHLSEVNEADAEQPVLAAVPDNNSLVANDTPTLDPIVLEVPEEPTAKAKRGWRRMGTREKRNIEKI